MSPCKQFLQPDAPDLAGIQPLDLLESYSDIRQPCGNIRRPEVRMVVELKKPRLANWSIFSNC